MFKIGLFKEPESFFFSPPLFFFFFFFFFFPSSSQVGPGTGKVRSLPSEVSAERLEQIAGAWGEPALSACRGQRQNRLLNWQ